MSTAPKKPYTYPTHSGKKKDSQESLRETKLKVERLRDLLQKGILDNPKKAKKAATILSLWIAKEGKLKK